MQVTVKLPTIFEARLLRHKDTKTIAVHSEFSRDIPEISLFEAPISLETQIDMVRHNSHQGAEYPLVLPQGSNQFAIREYDGRLFRKLHDRRLSGEAGVDNDPFPFHAHCSPIGKPIRMHYENRHFALARGLVFRTWPPVDPYNDVRNTTSFDSLQPLIKEIDLDSLETCRRMQARRLDGLICIDGDVWMETSTPCIMVNMTTSHYADNPQDVWIKTAFLPEWRDRRITTRYFPLHDTDGANAYVEELRAMFSRAPLFNVTDVRSYSGPSTSSAMDFDADKDFNHRYLVGLALNYGVCLDVIKLSRDERASHPVARAFDEAVGDNLVTGERADMASVADAFLADIDQREPLWSNQMQSEIGSKRANRLFFDYALRQLEDAEAINIIPTRTPN